MSEFKEKYSVDSLKGKIQYFTKTIVVDLDETILGPVDSLDKFGDPVPGALEFLKEVRDAGYYVIISTARVDSPLFRESLAKHLHSKGVPFDAINDDLVDRRKRGKPLALAYIDNRGVNFSGDWELTKRRFMKYLDGLVAESSLRRDHEEALQINDDKGSLC